MNNVNRGKVRGWWDWSSVAAERPDMMKEIRRMTFDDVLALGRKSGGRFRVVSYDTPQDFFAAEALEYIRVLSSSTPDNPKAICGPVGPVEQHGPLWRIVNEMHVCLRDGIFLSMDEFIDEEGMAIPQSHPLSFAKANIEGWLNRIDEKLRPAPKNVFHLTEDVGPYMKVWDDPGVEVMITQGGIGDLGHFAFNDPVPQEGPWAERPPTPDEYARFRTRIVTLHPWTIAQDARHSTGGDVSLIPSRAVTVGAKEVLEKSKKLSFWCPGHHSPAIVIWMLAWMIANNIQDSRMPQSLFARHPDVTYHLLRSKIIPPGIDVH